MTRTYSLASAVVLSIIAAGLAAPSTGCAPASEDTAASAAASSATDLAEARAVVAMLGGDEGRCSGCHGVTATQIRTWGSTMKDIDAACFAPEGLSAAERVNCLRTRPEDPASPFGARKLGLYAAGVSGEQFSSLFASAADYTAFKRKVSMPRGGGAAFTANEFGKIKSWVLRGMPKLDEAFQPDAPTGCTPSTTPELAAHLAAMKTAGWGARLADQATPMFGCNGAASPLACLGDKPDATATFGASGVGQTLRQLHKQSLSSHYWVRSSADGRYVGYGMNDSSKIVDLTKPANARPIRVAANYDPYFLPSNDGFAFAGAHDDDGIRLCRQSLLADVGSSASPSVSLDESKCSNIGDDVYMSIGTALDGDRYFMTFGSHENDDGGHDITSPLPANFSSGASTLFTVMVNDGLRYKAEAQVRVRLPGEGDMMLSPSSKLAATRFGDGTKQRGYKIRMINATHTDSGVAIDAPLGAEICLAGAKANFSFDERFVVSHQYVDHSEADQAELPEGSSNIVLADLATGKQVRITKMKAGEFALYPHFRADGWLYFVVRDMNQRVEYVVASDVALHLAQQQ